MEKGRLPGRSYLNHCSSSVPLFTYIISTLTINLSSIPSLPSYNHNKERALYIEIFNHRCNNAAFLSSPISNIIPPDYVQSLHYSSADMGPSDILDVSWSSIPSDILRQELARRQDSNGPSEKPACGSGDRGTYDTSLHVFALILILVLSTLCKLMHHPEGNVRALSQITN